MPGVSAGALLRVDVGWGQAFGDAVIAVDADAPPVWVVESWTLVVVGVAVGFDDHVVVGAQEREVGEFRLAPCPPGDQVVGVAFG